MGFYGKIYEQAVNIFNRLKFKNTMASTEFPEDLKNEIILRADGGETSAILNAGNKWIQFKQDGDFQCNVYHAQSLQPAGQKDIFTAVEHDSVDDTATGINFGTILILQYPTTDEAGHIIGYEEKRFQLQSDISALETELSTQGQALITLNQTVADNQKASEEMDNTLSQRITDEITVIMNSVTTATNAATEAQTAANNAATSADNATSAAETAVNSVSGIQEQLGQDFSADITVSQAIADLRQITGDGFGESITLTGQVGGLSVQISRLWSFLKSKYPDDFPDTM